MSVLGVAVRVFSRPVTAIPAAGGLLACWWAINPPQVSALGLLGAVFSRPDTAVTAAAVVVGAGWFTVKVVRDTIDSRTDTLRGFMVRRAKHPGARPGLGATLDAWGQTYHLQGVSNGLCNGVFMNPDSE